MDPEIEELKELVRQNMALTQDTNRLVHKLRRGVLWNRFFQFIWWGSLLALTAAGYYYYLQPYVQKAQQAYAQIEASGQQAQSWEQQVAQFFEKYGPQNTPQAPQVPPSAQ